MPPKVARGAVRRPAAAPRLSKKPAKEKKSEKAEEESKKFQKLSEVDLRKLSGRGSGRPVRSSSPCCRSLQRPVQ